MNGPAFEGFWKHGVIGVRTGLGDNLPRLTPTTDQSVQRDLLSIDPTTLGPVLLNQIASVIAASLQRFATLFLQPFS